MSFKEPIRSLYIFSDRVAELKAQAMRISRQIDLIVKRRCVACTVADVYVHETVYDERIISGSKESFSERFVAVFAKTWLSRILTPAIIFFGALQLMAGTSFVSGSLLALCAASISFVIETAAVVVFADEWKWRSLE